MKITFHDRDDKTHTAKLPYADADHVNVDGVECPICKKPLKAAGVKGSMLRGFDTYTSDAGCVECKTVLGRLVVKVNTLFGIEEDERVLNGRCRVY